ncbi:MAG: putative quinol monooxygenase [Acidimicrobiales bacterium]
MAEMITTGVWIVDESKQAAFLEEWTAFAGWARSFDGSGTLRLGRDGGDPSRFVSFGAWGSPELVHAWKGHAEFRDRMARVLQHVEDFHPTELDVVASATTGHRPVTS